MLKENNLCEKLGRLLQTMEFTHFTSNVYNSFIRNEYFLDKAKHLLEQLIAKCIDSELFETLLQKIEATDENIDFLKVLQTQTMNARY